MSDDPIISKATHFTSVECPHCKKVHSIELRREDKVVNPIPLADELCTCAVHTNTAVRFVDFVFDGPPDHYGPRLVEVEVDGISRSLGKWEHRKDGMWVLRMPLPNDDAAIKMRLVPEFEKHLTGDAKRVYNTQLKATVIETMVCETCKTPEFKPTDDEWSVYRGFPALHHRYGMTEAEQDLQVANNKDLTLEQVKAMPHRGHDFTVYCRMVQFMTQNFEVSLASAMVQPELVQKMLMVRAENMAKEFNRGVQNGWLKYGTLLQCHVIPIAIHSPSRRYIMTTMVASDFTVEELNEKFGKRYFVREGELGPLDVWPEPTFETKT